MIRFIKYTLLSCLSCLTLLSCVEDQDFNQFNEIGVTPTLEASILYVEAPESVVNGSTETDVINEVFNFDAFSSNVFANRVLDGTITYIVENTTDAELNFTVELLDIDDNILDSVGIPVAPAPMEMQQVDVTYGNSDRSIEIIKNTSSIRVKATNKSEDISASSESDPKVILKSSGKFRVEVIE